MVHARPLRALALVSIALAALGPTSALAGAPDSNPADLTSVGGTLFLSADDGTHGTELWSSKGTGITTDIVKDIQPDGSSGSPEQLTNVGGTLYFVAHDETGTELWKSGGTGPTTARVKVIANGQASYSDLTSFQGKLLLFVSTPTLGSELWVSNGTAAGTKLVKDIRSGPDESVDSGSLIVRGTRAYFFGRDTDGLFELWRTDGTKAGTQKVKDIVAGSAGASLAWLVNAGGTLFFSREIGGGKGQLW